MECHVCKEDKSFFDLHKVPLSLLRPLRGISKLLYRRQYPNAKDEPKRPVCGACLGWED